MPAAILARQSVIFISRWVALSGAFRLSIYIGWACVFGRRRHMKAGCVRSVARPPMSAGGTGSSTPLIPDQRFDSGPEWHAGI